MADRYQLDRQYSRTGTEAGAKPHIDQGLRKYMLGVYNYMGSGVLLTGIVALLTSQWAINNQDVAVAIYQSPLKWVIMLAPLAFVMVLSFGIQKLSLFATQAVFWAFAAVMGVSMSWIFLAYTGTSIAKTFFITAATFGALSLYGYTTKKDLSGWGTFLFMGVIGLIIASVVNIFLKSTMLGFVTSILGVLIFAGLTAYDTQRIREMYYQVQGTDDFMGKAMIMGALSLYLDFVNLFMYLLQFLGNRE